MLIAAIRSYRSRRDYGGDDGVGDFDFGDDEEVRREREQQRNGGMHRLDNDRGGGGGNSSYASGYNVTNSSNGIGGQGGKYAKPRASGTAITPGASFTVAEAQRLEKKVLRLCGILLLLLVLFANA